MRSLTLKLTLAFLAVGLIGALLVAFLLARQTRATFDAFVIRAYEEQVVPSLEAYYRTNNGWDDVAAAVQRADDRQAGMGMTRRHIWGPAVALLDVDGTVLIGGLGLVPGDEVPDRALRRSIAIEVDGDPVGYLLVGELVSSELPQNSAEYAFLRNINRATIVSALIAALIALLAGIVLARTIARPVRQLTSATHRLAQGELGTQVDVRSSDEIGELAEAFNQMSADLARSTQMRRQMTADIAHDLRTPLSVLMGYTEALNDGKLRGSRDIYGVMYKEAMQLNHLISDLRTLSLADAGELYLTRRPSVPRDLLEHAALAHLAQAQEAGIELAVETADPLPLIDVDPERIAQVLGNLVSNALRYTPRGGRVTLAAEPNGRGVLLSVADTGRGIPPENLPFIFDRFYRGDKARQQDGSSGLGLAIARSIVVAHAGEITVHSTVGEGTTFFIMLPIVPLPPA